MLARLYRRLFVCRRVGHSPALRLGDYCVRCGGYLYGRRR